ncbi:hypothetical protein AaE_015956 [Aphanomyces astaci]|uniref:DDE Tnp4 domain-containing protein n=1 Tax=Aphanomyces astaci TaxID=112090 RepID=A0A6A4YY12_APHAT|nr:hypothetical protein AaE_015956 [Aphanomyces astaci]
MAMSRNEFVMWEAAKPILGRHSSTSTTNARRFVALFGTTLYVTSVLWAKLEPHPRGGQPRHLLWALMFLKVYGTEHVHATIAAVDEKTYRKWSWTYIKALEDLTEVVFNNRFDEAPMGTNLFVSLDGTDCPVQEPFPFDPSWWSHKLNRAGIRYEVGICIRTGHIVWVNGGKPCGQWSDLALARDAYVLAVNEGEMTLADKGYMDRAYFVNPRYYPASSGAQKAVMSRHETANARLKQFGVLHNTFRHDISLHPSCFLAVVNIAQVAIKYESPLYSVNHIIN